VFISSHLMSEMALTAHHLIVIGQGRVIADDTIERIIAGPKSSVRVRSPQQKVLACVLEHQGATVRDDGGVLSIAGLDATRIGDLAASHRIRLHELTPLHASLENAFFELTEASVDCDSAANRSARPISKAAP
jgi:ABC-2 type transport system ATP-binding protein